MSRVIRGKMEDLKFQVPVQSWFLRIWIDNLDMVDSWEQGFTQVLQQTQYSADRKSLSRWQRCEIGFVEARGYIFDPFQILDLCRRLGHISALVRILLIEL